MPDNTKRIQRQIDSGLYRQRSACGTCFHFFLQAHASLYLGAESFSALLKLSANTLPGHISPKTATSSNPKPRAL